MHAELWTQHLENSKCFIYAFYIINNIRKSKSLKPTSMKMT